MRMVDMHCQACDRESERLVRGDEPLACRHCASTDVIRLYKPAPVRADDIPGGILLEHGLCNPDGSPRRYDSRSAIRREAEARGLVAWGEVYAEDRTKDARVRLDWYQSSEAKRAKRHRDEARAEKRLAEARR